MVDKITLGEKYKCSITGIAGIAVARDEWLYGCTRIGIQQKKLADGTVPSVAWIDEPQLEGVSRGKKKHGPKQDPGTR